MDHLALAALVRIVRFYKWAFGDLTDTDSDIGVIGEFLVGDTLGCLSEGRKAQDVFDLRTADDVSIEVKSTTTTKARATGDPIRSWMVSDQRTALEGKRPLADVWVFLAAKFPKPSKRCPAVFTQLSVFDAAYWTCWVVPGEVVRASGCRTRISEATLTRLGVRSIPFADFKSTFRKLVKERKLKNGSEDK